MEVSRQLRRSYPPCGHARRGILVRPLLFVVVVSALFLAIVGRTDAHKPVTSKYDYNRDVFPLLREHCARCHVQSGAAPMSLMTYKDAVPWAQSIRDELTAGRMPPWPIDSTSPAVTGAHPISSRDLDMIVVWASGGTPEGNPDTKLPAATSSDQQWGLGPPDLKIPLDAERTVAPGTIEENSEVSLSTNLSDTKWVKAADLMPGNASIVRDAVISIENGPVLALWEPGSDAIALPSGTAFRLAAGSKLHVLIHYKKHFDQEQNAVSDKSTIGLYFTDPPASGHELQSLAVEPSEGHKLANPVRLVALRPMLDRAYELMSIEAITPAGMHIPILRLRGPRPQWPRRYWLQQPVELAGGSQINVTVKPLSDYSDEPKFTRPVRLQVGLDYVAQ